MGTRSCEKLAHPTARREQKEPNARRGLEQLRERANRPKATRADEKKEPSARKRSKAPFLALELGGARRRVGGRAC